MATRATLSVEDVLSELDGNAENESDSDDDFDGYVDTRETTEAVEPVVEEEMDEQMDVGANVEVGSQSSSDDGDTLPEYTLQPGCAVPVEGSRPLDTSHCSLQKTCCRQTFMRSSTSQRTTSLLTPEFDPGRRVCLM